MINGNHYKEWANEIFPRIKENIDTLEIKNGTLPTHSASVNVTLDEVKDETRNRCASLNTSEKWNLDKNEIEMLWNENNTNVSSQGLRNCIT